MKYLIEFFIILLPWQLKRIVLCRFYGYKLHPKARIGLSYVFPGYLEMEQGAKIRNFTVIHRLDRVCMGENATIGKRNWITGVPVSKSRSYQKQRKSELIIRHESAITQRHHIDCTDAIHIGSHCIIAGYHSQLLTHSVNVHTAIQDCAPIIIGNYCFIGTRSIILRGVKVPDKCVIGAGSVVNKVFKEELCLYAGVPAKYVKKMSEEDKFFSRSIGRIS